MTLRGVFALVVFAILCICHVDAAYEVNCSGRVTSYADMDALNMAVWQKSIEALAAVYSSNINVHHIQTLNDTIVSRMEGAAYDLSSHTSTFTSEEKTNLARIATKAEDLYKIIEKYDIKEFYAGIKKAESILISLKEESEYVLCIVEDAFVIGDSIQIKVSSIRDQYQEVYDILEAFQETAKIYNSKQIDRAAE